MITRKKGTAKKQFLFYIKVVLADIPKLRKTGFECFDPFVIHCAKQPEGVARHWNQKLVSVILLIDELPNRPIRPKLSSKFYTKGTKYIFRNQINSQYLTCLGFVLHPQPEHPQLFFCSFLEKKNLYIFCAITKAINTPIIPTIIS